jgi:hypothetical protein
MRSIMLRAATAALSLQLATLAAFALPPISSTIDEASAGESLYVSAANVESTDAVLSASAAEVASAEGTCNLSDCCCCYPLWTIHAGAAILHRSSPAPLVIVQPLAGPGQVAGGQDYDFGWTGGPDVSIIRRLATGNSIEMRYFGALNWSDTAAYGAVGNVRIGSFSNFGATDLNGTYTSRLNSFEINSLRPAYDRITWLVGFRAIELHDVLNLNIRFPAFNADYTWNTDNHLYGGQVGTYLGLWNLDGPLTINAGLKAGIYGNASNNDFGLRPSTGGLFAGGASQKQVAFVGDVNIVASYQITSRIALRSGYQLLWIDRVALASDNAALATAAVNNSLITNKGNVFYHGALAGLTISW